MITDPIIKPIGDKFSIPKCVNEICLIPPGNTMAIDAASVTSAIPYYATDLFQNLRKYQYNYVS